MKSVAITNMSSMMLLISKQVAKAIITPTQKTLFFIFEDVSERSIETIIKRKSSVKKQGDIFDNEFVNNKIERKIIEGSNDFFAEYSLDL